jgi:hypothetical protein
MDGSSGVVRCGRRADDILIQHITTNIPALFGRTDSDIAVYLREREITVTVWDNQITIERHTPAPAIPEQRTPQNPTRLTQQNEIGGV